MVLTDSAVKAAKPTEKAYKLHDERGLFLLIAPSGGRWWRLKYAFNGREKSISLGIYPDTSLAKARLKRDDARTLVADGIDPSEKRKEAKRGQRITFDAVAADWLKGLLKAGKPSADTIELIRNRLSKLSRHFRNSPISTIKAIELLRELEGIAERGTLETAHRTQSDISRVFRHAIATSRAERDLTFDIRKALPAVRVKHHAAITSPAKVGELLRKIDGYKGQATTQYALRIAPYIFVRPGELRRAEWSEFDLGAEHPEWRIPAAKTKMRREHLVPLAHQVVELLDELNRITGDGKYVFPMLRHPERTMSENTINAAMRGCDVDKDEQTGHGFRTVASTLLNERGFHPDVIELQLGHEQQNAARESYNRAKRIDERRRMMQAWADYLDTLRRGKARA